MNWRMVGRWALLGLAATLVLPLAACKADGSGSGDEAGGDGDGNGDGDGDGDGDCSGVVPDTTPLRRLTEQQYLHTLEDLFGQPFSMTTFPDSDRDEEGGVFSTDSAANVVTELGAQLIFDASEEAAEQVTQDLDGLLPCDSASIDDACIDQFIVEFGERAFRRPLEPEEVSIMRDVWSEGAGFSSELRVGMLVSAFLQSPQFLYIPQHGGEVSEQTGPGGEALVRVSDWEMASRLSYFLWETMPDEQLFAAAAAGELHTDEQIQAQAERMLADERATDTIRRFHIEWLHLDNVRNVAKSEVAYPSWDPELASAMAEETERYVTRVVLDQGGTYRDLVAGSTTEINARLAAHYGIATDVSAPDVWFEATYPAERAGLLTQGAFLSAVSDPIASNPVKRGAFVQKELLCNGVPAPPPGIPTLGTPGQGETTGDILEQHREDPACASCHNLMDPPGLALENFDAIGSWRSEENGQPIDASGELPSPGHGVLGSFDNAREMMEIIADAEPARRCYAKTWFHYATGEAASLEEACTIDALDAAFAASDGDIQAMLVHLVTMPAFRHRLAND